ncbi:MAG: hypothetical protein ACP5E4_02255 [Candidatus Aenigmatarchaeota archaeon]
MAKRRYYKGSREDPNRKESDPIYERSTLAAVVCGSLIAFVTVLFWNYFHDWSLFDFLFSADIIGMIIVDLFLVFLIAYPAKKPVRNVIVLIIIMLMLGYLNYGPYESYVVGPLEGLKDSGLRDIPSMMGNAFHCITILFTNPMAFTTECELGGETKKAPEEAPQPVGIEITEKGILQDEIYPDYPLEFQIRFENLGDYIARNVTVVTNISSGDAKYRVCEEEIFKDATSNGYKDFGDIKPKHIEYYRLFGKVADPWTSDECTYATNKKSITAKIKTKLSYDYATESNLKIDVVRSFNETHEVGLNSELAKSAPLTIKMFTLSPYSWLDEDFRTKTIDLRLQHEYADGVMKFRGMYEFDTFYRLGETAYELAEDVLAESPVDFENWEWTGRDEHYDFCVNKTDPTQELEASDAEECVKKYLGCVDSSGNLDDSISEADCDSSGGEKRYQEGEPVYKARAKKVRPEGAYDEITVFIVGEDNAEFVNLSCQGNSSGVSGIGGCVCKEEGESHVCKIRYVGPKGDLEISKGDRTEILYPLQVNVTGFPGQSAVNSFTFDLHANATYSFEYSMAQDLTVMNPHY